MQLKRYLLIFGVVFALFVCALSFLQKDDQVMEDFTHVYDKQGELNALQEKAAGSGPGLTEEEYERLKFLAKEKQAQYEQDFKEYLEEKSNQ